MSTVAIIQGTDPVNTTLKALEKVEPDIRTVVSEAKPILIKPNYLNSKHPSTGITTDAGVVEGIIKFLRDYEIDREIVIGEGSGFADTFEAFKVAGVDTVAERWKVKLVDLNHDVFVDAFPPRPFSLEKVRVARTALESLIISVPKLKLHRIATITLSLKNMMGALASKGSMHRGRLSPRIIDLASVLTPRISVIDGIIAGEGHESSGNPVEMNLIIAGTDPVAVDSVGAAVMGISPLEVEHLQLAEKCGLGTCKLEEITVLGESIAKVEKRFHRSLSSKILGILG